MINFQNKPKTSAISPLIHNRSSASILFNQANIPVIDTTYFENQIKEITDT